LLRLYWDAGSEKHLKKIEKSLYFNNCSDYKCSLLLLLLLLFVFLCVILKGFQMTHEFSVLRVWLGIMFEERGDRNWYSINKQSDMQAAYANAHRIYYADNRLSPFRVAVPYNFSISVWIFRILNRLILFWFVDHILIQLKYVNNFKTNHFPKNISFSS
jgi:hypothetical protein